MRRPFVALANALDAKKALSKSELAAAAQERLLVLRGTFPPETIERLELLRQLATALERLPGDA